MKKYYDYTADEFRLKMPDVKASKEADIHHASIIL